MTFLKFLFWSLFGVLTIFCVCWFGVLIAKSISEYNVMIGASSARSQMAEKDKSAPIRLGVVCDNENSPDLYYGAKFEVEKINAAGGVNGRKLELVFKDNKGSAEKMLQITQEFCEDLKTVAVIGPEYSSFCEMVAPNFEYYGILQISPLATSPDLTTKGFSRFFRNTPDDTALIKVSAEFAEFLKWKNVAIAYYDDSYSGSLATMFSNQASKHFIKIPVMEMLPENAHSKHVMEAFSHWKKAYEFDAIFVISKTEKDLRTALEQLEKANINKPVMLDLGHDVNDLKKFLVKGMTIYMPILVDLKTPEFQKMSEEYKQMINQPISPLAFQSAEAVMLLAEAMKKVGSSDPAKVAQTMKKMKYSDNISGEIAFTENGNIDRNIIFLEIKNGQIEKLPMDLKNSGETGK